MIGSRSLSSTIVAALVVLDKGAAFCELVEGGFNSGELSLAASGFLPVAFGASSGAFAALALVTRVAAVDVAVVFVLVDARVGALGLLAIGNVY